MMKGLVFDKYSKF